MEALFIYIAKSSGLVILFYCAYYFLLRKETFFNTNRWFLLAGLITSILLPFLFYTKIVWVDPAPINNLSLSHLDIPQTIEKESFETDWNYIILTIYSIGFVIFLIKIIMDFYSLHTILKGKKIQHQTDYKFIDIKENISPFSYFQNIVYNSSMYTSLELENILEHEKVHSDQNHTVDVLISRFFCLLFWFNPIIWLYKKAIVQNLEFIADKEASTKISDKRAYQYTLLKITTYENCVAITNHFYQSLIKKRIVMLNKNQSKKRNSWKYYTVIPALVAFVLLFQIEVVAKEKSEIENSQLSTGYQTEETTITNKNTQILSRVSSLTEKEIYINGSKATEEEMNKLDPKEIVSMDVTKNSGKTIIKIITKNLTKPLKISDKEIYINGVKSSKEEYARLDKNKIDKIDVNTDKNTVRITTKTIQEEKPIVIINGDFAATDFDVSKIDPNKISSVNVFKGKVAEEKSGVPGKSVIEITTKVAVKKNEFDSLLDKKTKGTETKQNDGWKVTGYENSKDLLSTVTENKNIDLKKGVIIIDGKVSNYKELEKINSSDIKMVKCSDMKNYTEEQKNEGVKVYGEKAINGYIEIQTTEYYEKHKNIHQGYPTLK